MNGRAARISKAHLAAGSALFALTFAIAPAAYAQSDTQADPAEATASSTGNDIVVTARRTAERLQDVPVAVAAFGADSLQERRIESEVDLQIATPGLTVRQTGSSDQLNFAIRGQSIDSFSNSAPAVVAYFNDVPAGGGSATAFFDLSSIQVLKGPQGTLFGRNATGGAVLYSTAPPTHDFEGYAKAGYGNFNNFQLEGAINLPIGEALVIRFSGLKRDRDGFQRNLLDGTRANSIDALVGRVSVLIEPPSSSFSNTFVFQYGDFGGKTGATKIANANGVNGTPATYFDPITGTTQPLVTNFRDVYGIGGPGARVVPGFTSLNDFLLKQENIGFYEFYGNTSNRRDGEQKVLTNTTTFEVSPDMTIKNIFGYNEVTQREATDIDGSPYQFLLIGGGPGPEDGGYTFGTKQISNELQVSGETGSLTYIFGGFISKDEVRNRIPLFITPDLGAAFLGPYDFTISYKSKALYGQLGYAITDRLNLTGGLRYTWEDVSIEQAADSLLFTVDGERKDSKPSWLVGLDYRVTDDLLVYFNHRGSWRTGGFNGTSGASFPAAATFEPETTYDFELGAKFAGNLGGNRLIVNLAMYDQYINDVQRAPYLNISALAGNVNAARVTGFEVDGNIDIGGWLELGGALTHTNARFTDARATVAGANFIFGPYADSPEWSGSVYARVSHEFNDGSEVAVRGEFYSQAGFFYSNLNDTIVPNAEIDGYSLVNLRAEWNDIGGSKVSASAFVQNLTDEEYLVGGFPLGAVTGQNSVLLGTPRMYGVELRFEF
jgi:iron complex outermembrane receptor protein